MNRTTKAKYSLFAFAISTIATSFIFSNAPAYARARNCYAQFQVDGKVVKTWTNLGKVGGIFKNKKKKCKEKARNYARNIAYNQIGLSKQNVCDQYAAKSGAIIYYDTKVEGKINSRDGYIRSMLRVRCVCSGYKPV